MKKVNILLVLSFGKGRSSIWIPPGLQLDAQAGLNYLCSHQVFRQSPIVCLVRSPPGLQWIINDFQGLVWPVNWRRCVNRFDQQKSRQGVPIFLNSLLERFTSYVEDCRPHSRKYIYLSSQSYTSCSPTFEPLCISMPPKMAFNIQSFQDISWDADPDVERSQRWNCAEGADANVVRSFRKTWRGDNIRR